MKNEYFKEHLMKKFILFLMIPLFFLCALVIIIMGFSSELPIIFIVITSSLLGSLLLVVVISPLTIYLLLLPKHVYIQNNQLILKYVLREQTIQRKEIIGIRTNQRASINSTVNLVGNNYLVLLKNKRYDLHWLSNNIQGMIVNEFNLEEI